MDLNLGWFMYLIIGLMFLSEMLGGGGGGGLISRIYGNVIQHAKLPHLSCALNTVPYSLFSRMMHKARENKSSRKLNCLVFK